MEDELYVPDGVYLKCDQGAILTNLTVTPKKHKLYGLVIATEKDNVPLVNIFPFGKCSSSGKECVPKDTQWKNVHEGATKIEGQKPLLETSYCKCMQGGNIDIFFDEESASASLDNDKKGRVDKIPWLDSVLGVVLLGAPGVVISLATGGEPADIGRGFRQGLKGTWNFLSHDMWQGETWKGIGNMIGAGIVGYMPPTMSQYPSQAEIEMMQEWVNTTPEERIAGFDESMGTDLTATHEGIKQAASDFWDRKIENGTAAEGGVMVGETAEFIVELAVGSKGAGAVAKGIKGSATFANLSEKTAKAISTISEFVKTSKLAKFAESIKGIFKVGRVLKIRGVSFDDFIKTCSFPTDDIAKKAWDLFCKEDWAELEKLFKRHNLNEGWPPNRGFISVEDISLKKGDTFDRYGGWVDKNGKFHDEGTFVGKESTPYTERSLKPGTDVNPLQKYEVIKDIPNVKEGEAIPWFGEKGGGVQYELPASIDELIEGGYIKPIN